MKKLLLLLPMLLTASLSFAIETYDWTLMSGTTQQFRVINSDTMFKGRATSTGTPSIYLRTAGSSYFNGGNFGVGTTSPAGLFQVGGGSLTVLLNGNVGIGIATPTQILDVNGDTRYRGNIDAWSLITSSDTLAIGIIGNTPLIRAHSAWGSGGHDYLYIGGWTNEVHVGIGWPIDSLVYNDYGLTVNNGILTNTHYYTYSDGDSSNWKTAYDNTLQWSGGNVGLNAPNGRTSLEILGFWSECPGGQDSLGFMNPVYLNSSGCLRIGNHTPGDYYRLDVSGNIHSTGFIDGDGTNMSNVNAALLNGLSAAQIVAVSTGTGIHYLNQAPDSTTVLSAYLSTATAAATYLTQSSAPATYQYKGDYSTHADVAAATSTISATPYIAACPDSGTVLSSYITTSSATATYQYIGSYQPAGDYAVNHDTDIDHQCRLSTGALVAVDAGLQSQISAGATTWLGLHATADYAQGAGTVASTGVNAGTLGASVVAQNVQAGTYNIAVTTALKSTGIASGNYFNDVSVSSAIHATSADTSTTALNYTGQVVGVAIGLIQSTTTGTSYITGGNFGIGITNPYALFHVEGDMQVASINGGGRRLDIGHQAYGANSAAAVIIQSANDSYYKGLRVSPTGDTYPGDHFIGLCFAGNVGVLSVGSAVTVDYKPMAFWTGGTEHVRIDVAGNVGIGTTGPLQKLDVNGVIAASGGNSTNWNTAYTVSDAVRISTYSIAAGSGISITGTTTKTIVAVNVSSLTLSSVTDGHIVSLSASKILSGSLGASVVTSSHAIASIVPNNLSTGGYTNITGVGDLSSLGTTGIVGVGTTAPNTNYDLQVHGTKDRVAIGPFGAEFTLCGSSFVYLGGGGSGVASNGALLSLEAWSGGIRFGHQGIEDARFTVGGKLGIGTTNPSSLLHVTGSAANATVGDIRNTASDGNGIYTAVSNSRSDRYSLYMDNDTTNIFTVLNNGSVWIANNCSALSFTDRTPYPESTQQAYDAVLSMSKKLTGGVDHEKMNSFIRVKQDRKTSKYNAVKKSTETVTTTEYGRDMSATLSCVVEVQKDQIRIIKEQASFIKTLEDRIKTLELLQRKDMLK